MAAKKGSKMAMGGLSAAADALPAVTKDVRRRGPLGAATAAGARPKGASLMRSSALSRPAPGIPAQAVGRVKEGGMMESKAMHAKEEREIKSVKKQLMSHEDKPASKAHKGLKAGGVPKYATGGVIQKFKTGGVVGYKDGGHCGMKDGGQAGFKSVKKGGCW